MWRLLSSEIWRDGGSYSAVLTNGTQTVALWLQVSRWERFEERTYSGLFESQGTDPTLKHSRLSPEDEARWCEVLRSVLETKPGVDAGQHSLRDMIEILEGLQAGRGARVPSRG